MRGRRLDGRTAMLCQCSCRGEQNLRRGWNGELFSSALELRTLRSRDGHVESTPGRAKRATIQRGSGQSKEKDLRVRWNLLEYYDGDKEEWKEIGRIPSTENFNLACATWLPERLFKSLKSDRLLCDQEND